MYIRVNLAYTGRAQEANFRNLQCNHSSHDGAEQGIALTDVIIATKLLVVGKRISLMS